MLFAMAALFTACGSFTKDRDPASEQEKAAKAKFLKMNDNFNDARDGKY